MQPVTTLQTITTPSLHQDFPVLHLKAKSVREIGEEILTSSLLTDEEADCLRRAIGSITSDERLATYILEAIVKKKIGELKEGASDELFTWDELLTGLIPDRYKTSGEDFERVCHAFSGIDRGVQKIEQEVEETALKLFDSMDESQEFMRRQISALRDDLRDSTLREKQKEEIGKLLEMGERVKRLTKELLDDTKRLGDVLMGLKK